MDGSSGADPDGGFADPDGGFTDPEAVVGTDEDVSMSGDPNATGTPRASRGFVAAVISLTMTAVGSVVLSLPQVFAECGAVGGVAALAGFAALTDASLVILARAARTVDARTYEQTVTRVVGPTGGFVVRICLCVLLFGTLVSLQIIAADLAAPVVEAVMYHDNTGGFWSSRLAINTGVFALVYPLSLLENLSQLAAASSAAFFVMIGVAGVLVTRFAEAGFPVAADVALVGTNPRAIALALPVGALAYTCHFNVVEIARELRRDRGAATNGGDGDAVDAVDATNAPSRDERAFGRRVKKKQTRRDDEAMIRVVVWLVAFPFYAVFATVGYLGFGRDVSGDVLTEWIGDGEMAVAQIAVAGVNVLKYPLMGFALRGIVVAAADDAYARLARKNRGRARRRMPDERERLETRLLTASLLLLDGEDAEEASDASRGERARRETSSTSSVVSPHRDGASNEKPNAPPFVRAAALFAAHASVASCAVLLRRLALALDLIGATCGVTVAFIVPGWVLWCSLGKATSVGAADGGETARLRDRVLAATLVAAGVATSACGVAAVAAELV
jgi:amino acid permease